MQDTRVHCTERRERHCHDQDSRDKWGDAVALVSRFGHLRVEVARVLSSTAGRMRTLGSRTVRLREIYLRTTDASRIVKLLVEGGADVLVMNSDGQICISFLCKDDIEGLRS